MVLSIIGQLMSLLLQKLCHRLLLSTIIPIVLHHVVLAPSEYLSNLLQTQVLR